MWGHLRNLGLLTKVALALTGGRPQGEPGQRAQQLNTYCAPLLPKRFHLPPRLAGKHQSDPPSRGHGGSPGQTLTRPLPPCTAPLWADLSCRSRGLTVKPSLPSGLRERSQAFRLRPRDSRSAPDCPPGPGSQPGDPVCHAPIWFSQLGTAPASEGGPWNSYVTIF